MTAGRRHRWRPTLQAYLITLLVLFVLVAGTAVAQQRHRRLEDARRSTLELLGFQAALAADDIGAAIERIQDDMALLAADPAWRELLAGPGAPECRLTFPGTGPVRRGRVDIVDASGTVVCSSTGLPADRREVERAWLDLDVRGASVAGPVQDEVMDGPAAVMWAPIGELGAAASFVDVGAIERRLDDTFSGPLDVRFRLLGRDGGGIASTPPEGDDRLAASAALPALGWEVRADVRESAALAQATDLNRQLALVLAAGLVVLVVAACLLYWGLARPIERLSGAVRGAMAGKAPVEPTHSGPAEVVALAEDFSTLTRSVAEEMARRRQAEVEARASEESYRTLFAANPVPMWVYDVETLAFLEVNDAAVRAYGYEREELLAMTIRDIRPAADVAAVEQSAADAAPMQRSGPWRHVRKDGVVREVEITSHEVEFGEHHGRFVMAEDVTDREHATRLLHQAERMESLGHLAGGVAHDFNNVLAVMLSYAELVAGEVAAAAEETPGRWDQALDDIEQVGVAGRRAAALTHQLLSFARGGGVEVGPLDINAVVRDMEPLLQRTLGDRIELRSSLSPELWAVVANLSQVEQVLMNLSVNARDAMPAGGEVSMETANVEVDEHRSVALPELAPGRYVRLRVSDTGEGMDAEALDHAFEPFFTTKAPGSGTGLGLATVYGIVTRAGGAAHIHSEAGLGTSVTVLLPASDAPAERPGADGVRRESTGGEVVLVVEDDDHIRALAERILATQGFDVLTASNGPDALAVARSHRDGIDLLLTDVVMPDMLGDELAGRLQALQPELRVVFMSGYAPPDLVAGGRSQLGEPRLDKPFSAEDLVRKVREALDGPPATSDS